MEIEHVTTTTQIMQILPGDPPRILTGEWLHKQGKRIKFFQQLVPIRDADLYERFTKQVCKGDTIQVTIATEWSDMGYCAYLADFALTSEDVQEHQNVLDSSPKLVKENSLPYRKSVNALASSFSSVQCAKIWMVVVLWNPI